MNVKIVGNHLERIDNRSRHQIYNKGHQSQGSKKRAVIGGNRVVFFVFLNFISHSRPLNIQNTKKSNQNIFPPILPQPKKRFIRVFLWVFFEGSFPTSPSSHFLLSFSPPPSSSFRRRQLCQSTRVENLFTFVVLSQNQLSFSFILFLPHTHTHLCQTET